MHAQRLYNDKKWPNPIVLKITHATPALVPPLVETIEARWSADNKTAICNAEVKTLGDTSTITVYAEFRDITGMDWNERTSAWVRGKGQVVTAPGRVEIAVPGLDPKRSYEIRSAIQHPLLTRYGKDVRLRRP